MKALFIGVFLLLSGFSCAVLAEAMFHIQVKTEGDLVKGDKGLLKLAITNRSVEAADIVLRITQTDGQVLLDKQSCPLVRPRETCRATIAVTPAKAGDQRFVVEVLGFDAKYLCGKTVQLFTVYETERYKSVYLSDQKSEFAQAWALVHGLGNTEDATLYINRHSGDPLIDERGGRTVMLSQAIDQSVDLSQQINTLLARELEGFAGKIHLYIQSSMIVDASQVVIDPDLAIRLASVTVFPVDAAILHYDAAQIQKLAAFASDLQGKGTEIIKIMLWNTIDQNALVNGSLSRLGRLREQGVVFDNFSFINKGYNIAALGLKDLLLVGGLYAQLIPELSMINDGAFVPSADFKADNANLLYLGYHGYVEPHSEAWFEILTDHHIDALTSIQNKYTDSRVNPLYQSDSNDAETQQWVSTNGSISYFKPTFPLLLWLALNEGVVTFQNNNQHHTAYFPALPASVLSADNDLLYSMELDRIEGILSYSPINSQDYEQDYQAYTDFLQLVGRTPEQIPFISLSQWLSDLSGDIKGDVREESPDDVIPVTEQQDSESAGDKESSIAVSESDVAVIVDVEGETAIEDSQHQTEDKEQLVEEDTEAVELNSSESGAVESPDSVVTQEENGVLLSGAESVQDQIATEQGSEAEQQDSESAGDKENDIAVNESDVAVIVDGEGETVKGDGQHQKGDKEQPVEEDSEGAGLNSSESGSTESPDSVVTQEENGVLLSGAESVQDQVATEQGGEAGNVAAEGSGLVAAESAVGSEHDSTSRPGHEPLDVSGKESVGEDDAVSDDKPLYYVENLVAGFTQEGLAAVQASGGKVILCVKGKPDCIGGAESGCQLILLFACCNGVCLCPDDVSQKDGNQNPCILSMPLTLKAANNQG